jgi:hypothetical protein
MACCRLEFGAVAPAGDVMKTILWAVATMVLLVPHGHAQSLHELHVGAQEEQICPQSTIDTLADDLELSDLIDRNDQRSTLVTAACKVDPADRAHTFVALAYDAGKQYEKQLALLIIDNGSGRVLADYRGEIDEDAAMEVQPGSLWIDTAPYLLAPGVRAFGLDVTSGYMPNCGDGGEGAERSLYVREGENIRPVIQHLGVSRWQFIKRGNDRCNSMAPEDAPVVIEHTLYTLSVLAGTTHGFHDLRVTSSSYLDGDVESSGKRKRNATEHEYWTLKYDGQTYPLKNLW